MCAITLTTHDMQEGGMQGTMQGATHGATNVPQLRVNKGYGMEVAGYTNDDHSPVYQKEDQDAQQMRVSDNFFVEDDEDDFGYND